MLYKFNVYLPENAQQRKLQRWLENHFGTKIVVQSQQGQYMSNLIMSSSKTVADAIKAARNLKAELKRSQESRANRPPIQQSYDQLIHSVASVIRLDIRAKVTTLNQLMYHYHTVWKQC